MIGFLLRRLAMLVPSVFGVSLITFVLVNVAIGNPDTGGAGFDALDQETAEELGRAYGLHLPLFINLSIEDVQTRSKRDIVQLGIRSTRDRAIRSLTRTGGAALPYLLTSLPTLKGNAEKAALQALKQIAKRMGLFETVADAQDPKAFWTRYWEVYGSDFNPVRSARLIRRLIRRDDRLALSELKRIDTYCLAELMKALSTDLPAESEHRLVKLAVEITSRKDPLNPESSPEDRKIVISRWKEWWHQRYDMYTSFEGVLLISGAVTETRYFRWLSRVLTFDFGVSSRDGRPVRDKISKRLPITLLLSFLALLAAYLVAIPLGVITAVHKDSLFDKATTIVTFVLYSMPAFWAAVLLLRYFGSTGYLNWFPSQGLSSPGSEEWSWWQQMADSAHHLVLPVFCLSLVSMAMLVRYQRVGMLRIMDQDFIRVARAKGLGKMQVILRHGLRNGVIPVITIMGLQLPYLVSGSVVVERIFGIPGMGLETFAAIRAGDHAWLMAAVTVTAVLTMLGVVAADVIYAVIDPRIVPGRRLGKR